jgi:hypothetical protein
MSTEDKFILEKFYAENIDGAYAEVYNMLSDTSVIHIDPTRREKIIYTLMSLYFRTPKFLNALNDMTDKILNDASQYADNDQVVGFEIGRESYRFKVSELDTVKEEFKLKNKLLFLKSHLEQWAAFVRFKAQCGITIIEVPEGFDLITGDNPVIIRSTGFKAFNIFDPTNIVRVAIDRRRMLVIMPNTEGGLTDRIFRQFTSKWNALGLGLQVEKNCERQIFGYPSTLEQHDANQKRYGAQTPENLQEVNDQQVQAEEMQKLVALANEVGFIHPLVASKLKEMIAMKEFKGDRNFDKMIEEFRKAGLW